MKVKATDVFINKRLANIENHKLKTYEYKDGYGIYTYMDGTKKKIRYVN